MVGDDTGFVTAPAVDAAITSVRYSSGSIRSLAQRTADNRAWAREHREDHIAQKGADGPDMRRGLATLSRIPNVLGGPSSSRIRGPLCAIYRDSEDKYPFQFGVRKAKLILDHVDEIKAFAAKHEAAGAAA